jgi:hypothetical protein
MAFCKNRYYFGLVESSIWMVTIVIVTFIFIIVFLIVVLIIIMIMILIIIIMISIYIISKITFILMIYAKTSVYV